MRSADASLFEKWRMQCGKFRRCPCHGRNSLQKQLSSNNDIPKPHLFQTLLSSCSNHQGFLKLGCILHTGLNNSRHHLKP